MDTIQRVREILKNKYGIETDEDLSQAIKNQKQVDIGIFVSPCGMEGNNEDVG